MNPHCLVDENKLAAVRRPKRPVPKPGPECGQSFFVAGAIRHANCQFVFSRAIAEVGQSLAVRRPSWRAFGNTRAVSEVAHHAMFSRHCEYFPARLEDRALTRR